MHFSVAVLGRRRIHNGSAYETLIEHWDGTSWSIVTSPNGSTTQDNLLDSVTCTSASQCWAVGDYYNGSAYQTLIEQYTAPLLQIVTAQSAL